MRETPGMAAKAVLTAALVLAAGSAPGAQEPTREEVAAALRKACAFFRGRVAAHGGYVWRVSGDLQLREGEAKTDAKTIWVQPPGTPTVGEAFLRAYEAAGEAEHLAAARETAGALLQGQLRSGGWAYQIEFHPERRREYAYRVDGAPRAKRDQTTFDDDTTQAALRFLARLDRALRFQDASVHDAVEYGLKAVLAEQFPNGGWYGTTGRFPDRAAYPLKRAALPAEWPRSWTKEYTGCYVLNDDLVADMLDTLFVAADVYGDRKYLASARRAGDFLLLAQLPEPQPAWAQQYDREMRPTWSRKFEPPAVTGGESQGVLEALLRLYRRTGDRKYLTSIPPALEYLRRSLLPDGRLARFYELQTNRPLYFTRDYQLTYEDSDLPTHYGFKVPARLARIEAAYEQSDKAGRPEPETRSAPRRTPELARQARPVIAALDDRGAWVEQVPMRAHRTTPASGVIQSRTFADNVAVLCRYLTAR